MPGEFWKLFFYKIGCLFPQLFPPRACLLTGVFYIKAQDTICAVYYNNFPTTLSQFKETDI